VSLLSEIAGLRAVYRAPSAQQRLAFFSRGPADWPHLGPLVQASLSEQHLAATYVSSHPDDPGLRVRHPALATACVGAGAIQSIFFRTHRSRVFVTSVPDLGLASFQRTVHQCEYVFVPHSLVSTHMIYRARAFDEFDEVFCAGPHHEEEIRRAEALRKTNRKRILQFGFCKLDSLIAGLPSAAPVGGDSIRVLVAPSWGPSGLLELKGEELVVELLNASCIVTVRPHAETLKRSPRVADKLLTRFGIHPNFKLDTDSASSRSLIQADVMISDWSGAALEFAFAREAPLLFIDTPRKINNPDYDALGIEPIEIAIRSKLGRVLSLERLSEVSAALRELTQYRTETRNSIKQERDRYVYNLGKSASVGASRLARLMEAGQSLLR
jgi:hypothetical protein